MRKLIYILPLLLMNLLEQSVKAQDNTQTFNKKGYTLTFINNDPEFNSETGEKMVKTFFKVYPKLAKEYNENTAKKVTFVIDPSYKGVAATSNDKVRYSAAYMEAKPQDIDVVTHEVMHIVQAYPSRSGPGWLTEGIADYARYQFGLDNEGAGWSLPDFKEDQHYTNSYRVMARFLKWLEENKKKGIVKELDKNMRDQTYLDELWNQLAGKSLDELWEEYAQNPMI